jgi:hypothetical protein
MLRFQPYMFAETFVTGVIDPNAVGQPGIIAWGREVVVVPRRPAFLAVPSTPRLGAASGIGRGGNLRGASALTAVRHITVSAIHG